MLTAPVDRKVPIIATLWATYGPYHVARVKAIEEAFGGQVIPISHCEYDPTYPFFKEHLAGQIVLTKGSISEVRFLKAVWTSWRTLTAINPDLILAAGYERPETLGAVMAAKLRRIPIVLMMDNQATDSRRQWAKEWTKARYLRWFDGLAYAGPRNGEYLRKLGIPNQFECDGYDCVDNDRIANKVAQLKQSSSSKHARPYLLCIARMIPKKNIARLLQAYAHFRAGARDLESAWDLVLVGDGPEAAALKSLASSLGLESNVHFAGAEFDFDRIVHWYTFAQGLILASHESEQWGLVVNEALATGLPVLVSRQCGCSSSLVDDYVNGRLFDGHSVEQISEAIDWLHQQSGQRTQMSQRSMEIARRFSPQALARKILTLYQQTRARGGSAPE